MSRKWCMPKRPRLSPSPQYNSRTHTQHNTTQQHPSPQPTTTYLGTFNYFISLLRRRRLPLSKFEAQLCRNSCTRAHPSVCVMILSSETEGRRVEAILGDAPVTHLFDACPLCGGEFRVGCGRRAKLSPPSAASAARWSLGGAVGAPRGVNQLKAELGIIGALRHSLAPSSPL